MTRTVLVTGARGKTGQHVVEQLRGVPDLVIRAGSSQQRIPSDDAVQPVRFDWHAPEAWAAAVDGVDAIYLMRPDLPDAPAKVAKLLEASAGTHVVLLSEQGADDLPDDDWVRLVEDAVTARARTWTILRPSWFQQVLTDPRYLLDNIRRDRVVRLASGGAPIAWVDTRDVAAVAALALLEPQVHHGLRYTLTGPERVTVAAIAQALSAAVGETVAAIEPPVAEELGGLDPWLRDILDNLYRRVHAGVFGEVTPTVESLTQRPPRSVDSFIQEHAELWRHPAVALGRT